MSTRRWHRLPSLPLQLFIITVLPLTALLLLIAFGSLGLHQQAMRSMVGERDQRATRAAATAITEQINHRLSAVRSVALHAASGVASPDHALTDTAYLLSDFDGGIALFTADYRLIAASNEPEIWLARKVPARLDNLPTPIAQGETFSLPAFVDPTTGEYMVLVIARVRDVTAVGAFSPAALARRGLADIFGGNDQATTYLVTPAGDILYQTGVMPWPDSPATEYPGVADALRSESGTTYLTINGEEHVIAFSPIAPVGWALVIAESWRVVTDPMLRTTELAPLILIPVLVIALIALWFGVRQIVQPLQLLEQKATQLGWGNFQAIEEPVGGITEIQRLQAELVHMARKVQLAQQSLRGYLGAVTTGQEEERQRLAREIHDDTIQSLIALNQQIQLAHMVAPDEASRDRLATMQQMAEQTVTDLRRLTRDLRPIYLEDLGLVPALEMLSNDMRKAVGLPITFKTEGIQRRLVSNTELALYRIAQEGLSNVARHAGAQQAEVCLNFDTDTVCLIIRDDGQGFEVPDSPAEMSLTGHFGLLGIQERAEAIGARLQIESTTGTGTRLIVCLPLV